MTTTLNLARDAFAGRAWTKACETFASADGLERVDHERFAIAAYLAGRDEQCERAWQAAYHAALDEGASAEATRYAFWLGLCLMLRGQMAHAGGWLSRVESLVAEPDVDCPARGYLLIPALLGALSAGDAAGARDLAMQALDVAQRFGEADLRAFAVVGLGQALIAAGDIVAGTARLDEVMVSVTVGEVGPIATGIIYCAVILECMALLDLPRAAEWTAALVGWCDEQPDLVPYRGQCLVHRSQLQMAAAKEDDEEEPACSSGLFDSETALERTGRSFTVDTSTFEKGTYYYFCEFHRYMRGSFEVI